MTTEPELTPIEAVRQATATKAGADQAAGDADLVWRAAIQAAVRLGERVTEIADAAGGISVQRVYQIRDNTR